MRIPCAFRVIVNVCVGAAGHSVILVLLSGISAAQFKNVFNSVMDLCFDLVGVSVGAHNIRTYISAMLVILCSGSVCMRFTVCPSST